MILALSVAEIADSPDLLSTVTPGKLPTFCFNPVSALNRELFPLLGFPSSAICSCCAFNAEVLRICKNTGKSDAYSYEIGKAVTKCVNMA